MSIRILSTVAALALTAGAASAEYSLTILHTNDFHARFEPISKYDSGCSAEDNTAGECFGGTARLVTAIKDARERADNSLLVDGGDQRGLHRRFTTGEDDAVELGAALVEEREDLAPRDRAGAVGVDEVGVVTVDAVPRAPLKEDRRGQVVGPVCSRESRESGDA